MMQSRILGTIISIVLCLGAHNIYASVSPYNFGLEEAESGIERYWVLYNAHFDALKKNDYVDYSGIKNLDIEVPMDAISIPLGRVTDFKGVVFAVKNTSKDFYLFTLSNATKPIEIPQSQIDGYQFHHINALARGYKLLVVEDKTPWVNERKGYNHAVYRRDILLLKDGKAQNSTVMPYGVGTVSSPKCYYVDVDNKQKKIENIIFRRTEGCTYKTNLVQVENQNNILLKNIETETPANNDLFGDHIINIVNCTNVTFRNIHINGIYSPNNSWGYGIGMNNIYNFKCYDISGTGTVFGCNNINTSCLTKCNIARYDIHCYGRDVEMDNCTFWGSGFSTSSLYGRVSYKNCTFKEYFPLGIRSEYQCNVPFDFEIKNCVYYMSRTADYIIYTGKTNYDNPRRPELAEKCLPNVQIKDLKIIPDDDVKETYLFFVGYKDNDSRFGYMSRINVEDVKVAGRQNFVISTAPVELKKKVKVAFLNKKGKGINDHTSIIGNK